MLTLAQRQRLIEAVEEGAGLRSKQAIGKGAQWFEENRRSVQGRRNSRSAAGRGDVLPVARRVFGEEVAPLVVGGLAVPRKGGWTTGGGWVILSHAIRQQMTQLQMPHSQTPTAY